MLRYKDNTVYAVHTDCDELPHRGVAFKRGFYRIYASSLRLRLELRNPNLQSCHQSCCIVFRIKKTFLADRWKQQKLFRMILFGPWCLFIFCIIDPFAWTDWLKSDNISQWTNITWLKDIKWHNPADEQQRYVFKLTLISIRFHFLVPINLCLFAFSSSFFLSVTCRVGCTHDGESKSSSSWSNQVPYASCYKSTKPPPNTHAHTHARTSSPWALLLNFKII